MTANVQSADIEQSDADVEEINDIHAGFTVTGDRYEPHFMAGLVCRPCTWPRRRTLMERR